MKPATKCKANVSPLEGKVVVLTGGAGTSGRGLATELAQAGARLVLASRNVAALKRVAQTEEARGYKVHAIAYDQRDEKLTAYSRSCGRLPPLWPNRVSDPL